MHQRILTVVGARPQFVKAAVVSRALREIRLEEVLVHTGQHHDAAMSDIFFTELEIPPPAINLGISGGKHGEQTARMLDALERVVGDVNPTWVVVYGDTNSTLAGALAAAKLQIPIAHVEAGLRSFNRSMPEEINRKVADALSSRLFTPTDTGTRNLLREGHRPDTISQVGDVMYDATIAFADRASRNGRALERLKLREGEFILATIHRQENVDSRDRLHRIFTALGTLARELPVVLPLHPRARKAVDGDATAARLLAGVTVTDPVGYFDMLVLERAARVVLTDSGGVQKEAFFQETPCVTLRTETEWTELVDAGWNTLAPPTGECDIAAVVREVVGKGRPPAQRPTPYGNGDASTRIAAFFAAA